MKLLSDSEENTLQIAESIAGELKGGEVLLLTGDLGAGKTVFAKGIARGLGITETVTSPTFTVANTYEGRLKLYHFDMYRISDYREAEETGIQDFIGNKNGVCVIEWAENIKELLPKDAIRIDIQKKGDFREIEIHEHSCN